MSYKSKTPGLGRVRSAVIAILMVAAGSSAAWAQNTRGLAWALVEGASVPSASQYNSAGGAITVTNSETGVYAVDIPNMNTTPGGGVAHVTAAAGNHNCFVVNWTVIGGGTLRVDVRCLTSAGALTNGRFNVLFYQENRAATQWGDGYLFADQPINQTTYTPNQRWNSRGGDNTVTRTATGRYRATFPGLGALPNLGSVLVTAYQSGNVRCRVDSWGGSPNMLVNIACDNPSSGFAFDSKFTVSFISDTAFGVNQGEEQRRGAFAFADDAASTSFYTPSLRHQYNSAGGPIRASRFVGVGQYAMNIPGLITSFNSSNVPVSRVGSAGYCNPLGSALGLDNGVIVYVNCYNSAGVAENAQYVLTYLTKQLATEALPAPAGPARAKAWVLSNDPAGTPNPTPVLQFNSAGGNNSVTRLALGAYRADFPNLGTAAGIAHVNAAVSSNAYCKAHSWGPNDSTQEVYVLCFDSGGATVDSPFTVLFYKEDRTTADSNAGYTRVQIPIASTTAYQPPSAYSWNGHLNANQIKRQDTGRYQITFAGQLESGSVMVTPYGASPTRCKVGSYDAASTVSVACHSIDGTPTDSEFGVSSFADVAFGSDTRANAHPGGYALADDRLSASYQPSIFQRFNSSGGGILATRSAVGSYTMEFGLLKPFNKSVPMVTAFGGDVVELGAYCRPNSWTSLAGVPSTMVLVDCFNAAGAPVDSRYVVTYLTTPLAPTAVQSTAGTPQSTLVGTAFTTTLQATVFDFNIPVPGVTVTFAAPASGASATLSSATAVTNASGVAQVTATANGTAGGPYNVTASVAGVATPATFALTNTVPAGPVLTSISPNPGSNVTTTYTFTGTGFDPTTVRLEIVGGNIIANSDLSGKTTTQFTVVIGGPAGTYSLLVRNGPSGTASNTLSLTINDVTPVLISLSTSPNPAVAGQLFTMTINGSKFDTGTSQVFLNGVGIPTSVLSTRTATQLVFSVTLSSTSYTVTVRNGPNGTPSNGLTLNLNQAPPGAPVLTSLATSPSPAVTGQGFTLTVNGSGFDPVTAQILLDGIAAPNSALIVKTAAQLSMNISGAVAAGNHTITVRNGAAGTASTGLTLTINSITSQGSHFVPITPCRAADTRSTTAIPAVTFRDLTFGACGIPGNATAIALNVTLVPNGQFGFLSIWPAGQAQPVVSTMNSLDGRIKANAAVVGLGTGQAVSVFVTDTAHVILDVNGYFVPAGTAGALAFYPVTPCRVVDTRTTGGGGVVPALGTRRIEGGGGCLPAQAQAYSLNVTVVPSGPLGFLTLWPVGSSQPVVSTLNDLTGTVVCW